MKEEGFLNSYFAKRLLKENYEETRGKFLEKLMEVSRAGHLCMEAEPISLPKGLVHTEGHPMPKQPIVLWENRYYLQKNWVYETYILEELRRLKKAVVQELDEEIFFHELRNAPLLVKQKEAVESAFANTLTVICGGPGTGKTYTAAALVRIFCASKKKKSLKVALAAPTGKAASHIQSILGTLDAEVKASTLHSLLKITPDKNDLFSNRKIDADLILVDEASMIDVALLAQLLGSIQEGSRLILMGDPDQLPPVEAGSLFAEMAGLLGIRLEKAMRMEENSLLVLSDALNQGKYAFDSLLAVDEALIAKLCEELPLEASFSEIDPLQCLETLKRFRALGALRQGPFGIDTLNQKILEKYGRKIESGMWWAVPIMITHNAPQVDLYNGSTGILIGKSVKGGIQFTGSYGYFPEKIAFRDLPPFEVAFCLSVHKSQGSEFDKVLSIFPEGSEHFGREAIYTAVTRAKKEVEVAGNEKILRQMLSHQARRMSGFAKRWTTT